MSGKSTHSRRLALDSMRPYDHVMVFGSTFHVQTLSSVAIAAIMLLGPAVHAQVAPIPYLNGFGFNGGSDNQYWGDALDEDGFRKGFSLRTFSAPVSAFSSGIAWAGIAATALNAGGLTSDGAQYGYSFRGINDTPVTLFGSVNSLRTSPDVFTSLVTPGFERSNTLATSVNAGVEFKPSSNLSLSFSAGYTQSPTTIETDLRSQLLSGARR